MWSVSAGMAIGTSGPVEAWPARPGVAARREAEHAGGVRPPGGERVLDLRTPLGEQQADQRQRDQEEGDPQQGDVTEARVGDVGPQVRVERLGRSERGGVRALEREPGEREPERAGPGDPEDAASPPVLAAAPPDVGEERGRTDQDREAGERAEPRDGEEHADRGAPTLVGEQALRRDPGPASSWSRTIRR